MAIGLISLNSYSLADTFFVGQLGTFPLAAMGFTFPVTFSLMAIGLGIGIGASSVISRLLGTGDIERVQRITTHALLLAAVLGGVVSVVGFNSIDFVFSGLGAGPKTLPLIRQYMQVYYLGGFFMILPMVGNFSMRAAGDARVPAVILSTSAFINIALDPVLIFGLFGFPRLELRGAAIATVLANAVTVVASIAILRWREQLIRARYVSFHMLLDSWRRLLHIGVPAMASNLLSPITIGVITLFVSAYGPPAVAGFGVASRVESVIMIVIFAVTSSVGPFTGQNFGAGRLDRVRHNTRLAERFCLLYGFFAAAVLWLGGTGLVGSFNDDRTVIAAASLYLTIVPFSLGSFGVMLVAVACFNALGRPLPATALTFVKLFIAYIPLAWLLAKGAGLSGIFWANACCHVAFGAVGFLLLRRALDAMDRDAAANAVAAGARPTA